MQSGHERRADKHFLEFWFHFSVLVSLLLGREEGGEWGVGGVGVGREGESEERGDAQKIRIQIVLKCAGQACQILRYSVNRDRRQTTRRTRRRSNGQTAADGWVYLRTYG